MAEKIIIKKGLAINLAGKADERMGEAVVSSVYSIVPDDFSGIVPKIVVKAGDKVLAGQCLFFDKNFPEIQVASPVSGEVQAVNRGERRKVLNIEIKADASVQYQTVKLKSVAEMNAGEIKQTILDGGLWWLIKQRPFDVVARPNIEPRDIFITGFDSAPLATNIDFACQHDFDVIQTAVDALKKMTTGKVYLSITLGSRLSLIKGVSVCQIEGSHPAGNVGVQINHIAPVNKGETVWTLSAFDLILLGRFLQKGHVDMMRTIAVTGSEVVKPHYVKALPGTAMVDLLKGNVVKTQKHLRYISGNPLTGKNVTLEGALGMYDRQITVIPEGDDCYEFVGWGMPGLDKFSVSRTYFSWLMKWLNPEKEYVIDARIRGGERGIIMSNEYDRVFPMDILPEQLIKATMAFNIEKMENLGIYEVAPEDFALCEFVDTSKLEIQQIIREGLDKLMKEVM